jgi:hypothetical protein
VCINLNEEREEDAPMSEQNYRRLEFANKAKGFDGPTQLPRDDDERRNWQNAKSAVAVDAHAL